MTIKSGTFPIGAGDVYRWRYQKELADMRAYVVGHAARNVRCVLNLAAALPAPAIAERS